MSYKAAVLYDYPIAYYPLDDLTTVDLVQDFTDFLAQFSTYQDVLDNVSSYANIYGDIVYDHSGCENDGNYIGDPDPDLVPIVAGNSRATNITNINSIIYNINNDYTATATNSQFGTASSSDNDFTIECWFYPSFTTTSETPIVADPTNEVGVFYENGNIVFKVDSDYIEYSLTNLNKVYHICAVYSVGSISLYIDGQSVMRKILTDFTFSNTELNLQSGPTNSTDWFLLNSVAIYRYSLPQTRMTEHFNMAQSLPAIQIAGPDNGELFELYDDELSCFYKFQYPQSKSWDNLIVEDISYNQVLNCLEITQTTTPGANSVIVEDFISIPINSTFDSSKIEWNGDNGITIETSIDNTTFTQCVNGEQIPDYDLNNYSNDGKLYIKITFTSSDTSRFIPRLYDLTLSFYGNQTKYAYNGNSFITTLENDNAISNYNITVGRSLYHALSRFNRNGLRTVTDSGFHVTTEKGISTVEFFYTPFSLTTSGLISTTATNGYSASNISWNNLGTMSKTNISAIYVNGVNKTAETNVSNIFREDQLHHVVVVFASAVSNEIRFNYSLSGSVPALYQYIAIYQTAFNSTKATDHYDYYIRKQTEVLTDTSILGMTEDGVSYYNNDWVVIQNT